MKKTPVETWQLNTRQSKTPEKNTDNNFGGLRLVNGLVRRRSSSRCWIQEVRERRSNRVERVLNKRTTEPDQGHSRHDSQQRDPSGAQVGESE